METNEKLSVGQIIKFGWEAMQANIVFFIIVMCIVMFIAVPLAYFQSKNEGSTLLSILTLIISIPLSIGTIRVALDTCDKKELKFSRLIPEFSSFIRVLGLCLLIGIICGVSVGVASVLIVAITLPLGLETGPILFFLLFVFFYFLLYFLYTKTMFAMFFVVDQDASPIDALRASFLMTNGNVLNLFLLAFILYVINIMGALVVGIGLFITIPISAISLAYTYRLLSHTNPTVRNNNQLSQQKEETSGGANLESEITHNNKVNDTNSDDNITITSVE